MTDRSQPLSAVEKLTAEHDVKRFDCGKHSLNDFLKRYALKNAAADSSRTYVVHRAGRVVAYYAVAPGSVAKEGSTERAAQGMPNYPIGVVVLARLAVDKSEQGVGLGSALMKDAFLRIVEAAAIISARAILVHAIDDNARAWYIERFGFEPCPGNALQLMLPLQDVRAAIASVQRAGSVTAST